MVYGLYAPVVGQADFSDVCAVLPLHFPCGKNAIAGGGGADVSVEEVLAGKLRLEQTNVRWLRKLLDRETMKNEKLRSQNMKLETAVHAERSKTEALRRQHASETEALRQQHAREMEALWQHMEEQRRQMEAQWQQVEEQWRQYAQMVEGTGESEEKQ
jgi:hypothetical protein